MSCNQYLSIAGITLRLETLHPLGKSEAFLPFLTEPTEADYHVMFRPVSTLRPFPDKLLHAESCYRFYLDDAGKILRFFFEMPWDEVPYAAASCDGDKRQVLVEYLEGYTHCVSELRNSFYHVGFEALLIRESRLWLHASCVQIPLGGILFSGPSGIGKSTQAGLWCQYRGARQINGDRPILSRSEDGWRAWGAPYAGSSRCYVNDSTPVTAIVMLRQAECCKLRRLSAPEAFRAVWSGLTVHPWDEAFVEAACDLTMELIGAVPVFEFCCTPDEQAVDYLEQQLRKECGL